MIDHLTPEALIGITAIFGSAFVAVLMLLSRFGIIKFANREHCISHEKFYSEFKVMRDECLVRGTTIVAHTEAISEMKGLVASIEKDIAQININIRLLVDRYDRSLQIKKDNLKITK